jgi:ribosome-binding protein aMBF1 (putative translation factor)
MIEPRSSLRNELRRSADVRDQLLEDPDVRDEWERTAVARALALILVRYRARNGLSQSALADKLGMKQPAVARLERGDRAIRMETLFHILDVLGVPFSLEFEPGEQSSAEQQDSADKIHEHIRFRHGGRMEILSG